MDCEQARALFTSCNDGDLSGKDLAAFNRHIDECSECSTEWSDFKRTVGEVSGLRLLLPQEDFSNQVVQRIRRRSKGRFFSEKSQNSVRFAVISFILILIFMLAYLFITYGKEIRLIGAP